jgi:hypothetical protein
MSYIVKVDSSSTPRGEAKKKKDYKEQQKFCSEALNIILNDIDVCRYAFYGAGGKKLGKKLVIDVTEETPGPREFNTLKKNVEILYTSLLKLPKYAPSTKKTRIVKPYSGVNKPIYVNGLFGNLLGLESKGLEETDDNILNAYKKKHRNIKRMFVYTRSLAMIWFNCYIVLHDLKNWLKPNTFHSNEELDRLFNNQYDNLTKKNKNGEEEEYQIDNQYILFTDVTVLLKNLIVGSVDIEEDDARLDYLEKEKKELRQLSELTKMVNDYDNKMIKIKKKRKEARKYQGNEELIQLLNEKLNTNYNNRTQIYTKAYKFANKINFPVPKKPQI